VTPEDLEMTIVLNYHCEGHLAVVSATSAMVAAQEARDNGFSVRMQAVLDRPDALTREAVRNGPVAWDTLVELDHGDLGMARNSALLSVDTPLVTFMDGDDLCGRRWLRLALESYRENPIRGFLHPEYIYYFSETDSLNMSSGLMPAGGAESFFMRQIDSEDPSFAVDALRFNNVFTSNQCGPTSLYREFPFLAVNREDGFGVEDWTWNAFTISQGIRHAVVKDAVHLVRVKTTGSLGKENERRALLPDLRRAFTRAT
jgi:hypothetical protein